MKVQVRDTATSVPTEYEAPLFKSTALQHTKPTLTWDEDSVDRKKVLNKKITADDLKEDDFKAYLASDTGSEAGSSENDHGGEEDVDAIRARCGIAWLLLVILADCG